MYIQIKFVSKKSILIELFDNSATKKWFEKYSKVKFKKASVDDNLHNHASTFDASMFPEVLDQINANWDNIKQTLSKLKELGLNSDFNLPRSFNFDQVLLNQLHRFFTYNVMWYDENFYNKTNIVNPFDPNFKIEFTDPKRWHKLLNEINSSVHYLETYTTTPNTAILNKYPLNVLQVYLNPEPTTNSWIDFTQEEQQENYNYQQYKTKFKKPLVILDNCILGKSYLQSFLDYDDPTCKDCSGRTGTHGNFFIELDNNRNSIYNSKNFKEWVEKLKNFKNFEGWLEKLKNPLKNFFDLPWEPPLEFPIGVVIKPHPIFLKSITKSKVQDVVFFKTWPGDQESNLD